MKIYTRILSGATASSMLAAAVLISATGTLNQASRDRIPDSSSYSNYRKAVLKQFNQQFITQAFPEEKISRYIVASWYGPRFHGRLTASGEIFNMYARTCAHRTHAFGTKLKIVNLLNNKSTECVVNDRGPYIAGRDLDLSRACAEEIDLTEHGIGVVKIDPYS